MAALNNDSTAPLRIVVHAMHVDIHTAYQRVCHLIHTKYKYITTDHVLIL